MIPSVLGQRPLPFALGGDILAIQVKPEQPLLALAFDDDGGVHIQCGLLHSVLEHAEKEGRAFSDCVP